MALTGTLQADFSQFVTSCDKADAALRKVEQGGTKTGAALDRMVSAFSGQKVIQDANMMVTAVERIGGVSKLTESELSRVGRTANEAADKMRRMGIDVPPGLQKIADDTKKVDTAQSTLGSTLKQVALGFGAFFTARAAVNFAANVMQEASALNDLSQQTRIGVEDLQRLSGAMSEFGVDTETLGHGLFTLSRKIAGGDQSVATALHAMGMTLKDVQGLEGEALFLKIERGLATLQGSLRDTTAAELFGSRLGMAMGGAAEGIDHAMARARELNTVMSTEAVAALDQYSKAIKRAQDNLTAMGANMMGPVAEGANMLFDALNKGASKWDLFVAMVKDFATTSSVTGANTTHLAKALDELNQQTAKTTTSTQQHGEALTKTASAAELTATLLKSLRDDYYKPLSESTRQQILNLKDWGVEEKVIADTLTVTAGQIKRVVDEQKGAEESTKQWNKAIDDLADSYTKMHSLVIEQDLKMTETLRKNAEARAAAVQKEMMEFRALAPTLDKQFLSAMGQATGTGAEQKINTDFDAQIQKLQTMRTTIGEMHPMVGEIQARIGQLEAERAKALSDLQLQMGQVKDTTQAVATQHVAATQQMADGWKLVGTEAKMAATNIQLAVPQGFSYTEAYRKAGLFVHDISPSSVTSKGKGAGPGWGMPAMNVTFNDAFIDTPAGAQRTAERVGQAVVNQLKGQGTSLG